MSIPETTVKMQFIHVRVVTVKVVDMFQDDSKGVGGEVNSLHVKTALWKRELFRT